MKWNLVLVLKNGQNVYGDNFGRENTPYLGGREYREGGRKQVVQGGDGH